MKDFIGERTEYGFGPFSRPIEDRGVAPNLANSLSIEMANAFLYEHATGSIDRVRGGFYARFGKRALDIVLVSLSLPISLPLIGICALALWIEGGHPFYRQTRLGRNGKAFSILKLRTMVRDADAALERHLAAEPALRCEWDAMQKLKVDPRITSVGSFLRSTSLDELPQLLNVLIGEMSLVGPRPMMPEQLAMYGEPAAYFAQKPGITGLWQVSARNANTFAFRQEVDADYDDKVMLKRDLGILVKTISVVLRRTGY